MIVSQSMNRISTRQFTSIVLAFLTVTASVKFTKPNSTPLVVADTPKFLVYAITFFSSRTSARCYVPGASSTSLIIFFSFSSTLTFFRSSLVSLSCSLLVLLLFPVPLSLPCFYFSQMRLRCILGFY